MNQPIINRNRLSLCYLLLTAMLSACDGSGGFGNYSNYDLSQQHRNCQKSNLSPSAAQRCNNIEKECSRRKEATGFRC